MSDHHGWFGSSAKPVWGARCSAHFFASCAGARFTSPGPACTAGSPRPRCMAAAAPGPRRTARARTISSEATIARIRFGPRAREDCELCGSPHVDEVRPRAGFSTVGASAGRGSSLRPPSPLSTLARRHPRRPPGSPACSRGERASLPVDRGARGWPTSTGPGDGCARPHLVHHDRTSRGRDHRR